MTTPTITLGKQGTLFTLSVAESNNFSEIMCTLDSPGQDTVNLVRDFSIGHLVDCEDQLAFFLKAVVDHLAKRLATNIVGSNRFACLVRSAHDNEKALEPRFIRLPNSQFIGCMDKEEIDNDNGWDKERVKFGRIDLGHAVQESKEGARFTITFELMEA